LGEGKAGDPTIRRARGGAMGGKFKKKKKGGRLASPRQKKKKNRQRNVGYFGVPKEGGRKIIFREKGKGCSAID